ncbi:hypothetical protein [Methylobacterium sp. R2-1]|uniref:hypothetical protein n=1 Tax=Methylobacterium sp. R2-1 TaxID=2587064 RepID=UPI00161D2CDC|nr:hypothetical protein [Methylobacterium sp. R2-1]MBB2961903.1 hypothetical protein [Methylobacterium sp. R2-1]
MAGPADDVGPLFPVPDDRGVGISFGIDLGGRPPTLHELSHWLDSLRRCRASIIATTVFGRWAAREMLLYGAAAESAALLLKALRESDEPRRQLMLTQFTFDLGLLLAPSDNHPSEMRLDFVGAYRENPTHLRFIGHGATYALAVLVSVFGAVQMRKEWTAEACQARVSATEQAQLELLFKAARMEGGWSSNHVESHRATVAAAAVASRACGSLLRGIGVKLHVPPGATFEIRLEPTDPASTTTPVPGR